MKKLNYKLTLIMFYIIEMIISLTCIYNTNNNERLSQFGIIMAIGFTIIFIICINDKDDNNSNSATFSRNIG